MSWRTAGNILLSTGSRSRLYRVAGETAEWQELAAPDIANGEKAYRFAEVLPDGDAVIFTRVSDDVDSYDDASIALLSLATGEVRTLLAGGASAQYSPTGHLVYARAGALFAVPFDASALDITGPPVRVVEGVATDPTNGSAQFSLSRSGSLLYSPGRPQGFDRRVVWVDRAGRASSLIDDTGAFIQPILSPDGRTLALSMDGANQSLWVYDIARGVMTRIVSGGNNRRPVWTAAGNEITFGSDREGTLSIFSKAADGSGQARRLVAGAPIQGPAAWTPDGRTLIFDELSPENGVDIRVRSPDGSTSPFLATRANEANAALSPNGRWIAYQSDESGRTEIYLRPFPDAEPKSRVSTDGGSEPLWNPNGRELFFRSGRRMMAVDIETEGSLAIARPRQLFESEFHLSASWGETGYDVSADGERFVMIDQSDSASPPTELIFVENWATELKRLVPVDR